MPQDIIWHCIGDKDFPYPFAIVRIPKGYKFTKKDVEHWIKIAKVK